MSTPVSFTIPSAASLPNPDYGFSTNGGYALGFVGQPVSAIVYDINNNTGDTYTLVSGPSGMTIDSTGMLSWTPTVNDIGTASPVVALANSAGTVDLTIPITVTTFAVDAASNFGAPSAGTTVILT